MNNTFNLNRFALLIKRQWLDFGKIYLISLVVIVGVIIGFYSWNLPIRQPYNNLDNDGNLDMRFRYGLFLILGFIFITVVASSYFALLGQKPRVILELLTPASVFEKFLCSIFYTSVLSIATYLVLFYLVDVSFVKYINSHIADLNAEGSKALALKPTESIAAQTFNDENYRKFVFNFFGFPLLFTSIFLLGSIYFNRFHYIKTAVSVMVFSGVAIYIIKEVADLITRNMVMVNHTYSNDKSDVLTIILLVTIFLTLIFWAIAYVRLKEKEV